MCGLREGRSLGIECNEDRLRNSEWRPTKLHRDRKKLQLVRFPHCSKFDSFEVTGKAKLQKGRKLWLRYRTEVDIFKNLNCIKIDRYGKNVFSFANTGTSLFPLPLFLWMPPQAANSYNRWKNIFTSPLPSEVRGRFGSFKPSQAQPIWGPNQEPRRFCASRSLLDFTLNLLPEGASSFCLLLPAALKIVYLYSFSHLMCGKVGKSAILKKLWG